MMSSNHVFRIDTHVHTGRYSQCAEFVDPYEIESWSQRSGLDGIVLTDHDIFWQDEEIDLLRASCKHLRIYRGIEVTARGCHLVVIGIDDAVHFQRGISMDEVVELASEMNAAVILAHPFRDSEPSTLPVQLVDAIEVGSTSFSTDEAAKALALAHLLAKPMVAASDAHALSRIGWAWTEFPILPQSESELAALIRSGLGTPVIPQAFLG
jgi:hypothetical protein